MEEGDDDLWDSLIHLSISNPSKFNKVQMSEDC